ncbi:MAG: hypothetical protein ACF8R7_00990 [Phycisphaerales bacterium JB039]
MSSSAGQAAEPSLSLRARVTQAGAVCLGAVVAGSAAGDPLAALLGASAVALPTVGAALALRRLGRREASLMAAVALVAPCLRLGAAVALGIGVWLAAPMSPVAFWGAFFIAALGTLAVDTLGFAADFRALATDTQETALA